MRSNQDGTEIPPYAAETAAEIGKLGRGGKGNSESLEDAAEKGVTPKLMAETAERASLSARPGTAIDVPTSWETATPENEKRIRDIAYSIWLVEGQPHGRDVDHWLQARRIASGK